MLPDLKSLPEWHAACKRYRYNITRFAVEALNMTEAAGQAVTPQQELLFASIVQDGSRTSVASGHGTGKTRSAGIVALWHLLFFPDSVMMFTAPQIRQLRQLVWKEISICKARLLTGRLAWLAEYVTILAETVYIRGHEKTWHVIAKTAPKNRPENLAGQHGDNYFFWGDEACAIENEVLDVALGALTHKNNRAVLTSQPARPSGFFFDTHHTLSIAAGGVWNNLTFNGELSSLVSRKTILEMYMKYGSRDDPGYMIRVRGLFPDLANEFLVTRSAAASTYAGTCIFNGQHDDPHNDYGYFIVVDVGGGVGRDDSVVGVAKVWGDTQYGERARRVEIVKIPLCKNNDNLHELTGVIDDCLQTYPNATILLDAIGAGSGLSQHLTSKGIYYEKVNWSGACFSKSNKEMYANKRSQAYVCLKKAIDQGRFKITVPEYRNKVQEQITRIPYIFDDKSRFKIQSKEDMRKRGIKSPDIADIFAFCFLEGFYYTSANEVDRYFGDSHARDEFDELDEALKRAG